MQTLCHIVLPFEEDRVWIEHVRPWVTQQTDNGEAVRIANHAVTEMLNNVRDHSASADALVLAAANPRAMVLHVVDHGVGVFARLAEGLGLAGPREALIEVVKGKRTTDPVRHTGEGIFFSSLACEWFCIEANGFALSIEQGEEPTRLQFRDGSTQAGTTIKMRIAKTPALTLRQVFDSFCPQPDISFTRTRVAVQVMEQADGGLVSRSQARRLMAGLELFTQIELDLAGVAQIGQGFADEVFRVWRNSHPATSLSVLRANDEVSRMIKHAAGRSLDQGKT